jgi:hypothetical protein
LRVALMEVYSAEAGLMLLVWVKSCRGFGLAGEQVTGGTRVGGWSCSATRIMGRMGHVDGA